LFANRAAARIIGFESPDELLSSPVAEVTARFLLFDEHGKPVAISDLPGRRALAGDRPDPEVFRFTDADGRNERWSEVSASPVFFDDGSVKCAVNVFRDITELKQAQAETERRAEDERIARRAAEKAQHQLAFLAEASQVLAESLDYQKTLTKLSQLAVPKLADLCVIDVVDEDGTVRRLGVAHQDPEKVRLAEELHRRYPPDPNSPTGVPSVLRTGRSELYEEISDDVLGHVVEDEDHVHLLEELGLRSAMVVPLRARGRTLAAMSFMSSSEGLIYGESDLAFAEDLGRRAALAMDNARLYQERSRVARTLQRSLLPPELPKVPGCELAAAYLPAGEGNEVGGDFYDCFAAGEGKWGLVIGDVGGKGAEAASVTGLARHTIRAAAGYSGDPLKVLRELNSAIRAAGPDTPYCTVMFAIFEPAAGGGGLLTVACAGHPQPLMIRADGSIRNVGGMGMLLGAFEDPHLTAEPIPVVPGDTLFIYTDGVIDERLAARGLTEARLLEIIAENAGGTPATLAQSVVDEIDRIAPEQAPDDVAILVLGVGP
jgi:PAS domain S-box-containing protein